MIASFKLGGKEYYVVKVSHDTENLGSAIVPLNKIEIQDVWRGKEVPQDSKEQTFYHELVHCIFDEIGRNDLSEDEALVQSFALLLHQFESTKQ